MTSAVTSVEFHSARSVKCVQRPNGWAEELPGSLRCSLDKPGSTSHYIEADKIKVAQDHILFTDESGGLTVVDTLPGLIVIDQESERGTAAFPR